MTQTSNNLLNAAFFGLDAGRMKPVRDSLADEIHRIAGYVSNLRIVILMNS